MPKGKPFNALKPRRGIPHGMFSTLEDLIEAAPQERMTAQQWKEYLAPGRILEREGVKFPLKKEELEYTIGDWLAGIDDKVGGAVIEKANLLNLVERQRPRFERDVSNKNVNFDQYSTQGPSRLGYFESITDSPDFGKFSTHFGDETLSWHRGSRHYAGPQTGIDLETGEIDRGVLRLIDEIQSDRHSAAAEKIPDREAGNAGLGGEPMRRRGYRTPEQEARYQELSKLKDVEGRGIANRDGWDGPGDIYNEFGNLRQIPPDAPFKSPADYGRLELKQGLLDAIRKGDQYLGVTPSEGPIGWFGLGSNDDVLGDVTPMQQGMQYAYDKVYPGELRKLAQQYGAPTRDIDLPVTGRSGGPFEPFDNHEVQDLPDYLESVVGADLPPDERVEGLHELLEAYEEVLADNSVNRNLVAKAQNQILAMDEMGQDGGSFDTSDLESILHRLEAKRVKQNPATNLTRKVPAMELTPEVIERIRKAGIPLWAITGGIVGADALMEQDRTVPQFSHGGPVDDGYDPDNYPELTEHQNAVEDFLEPSLMRRIANFGPDGPGKNRRKNFMTGLLTQTMGVDTEGEPSFLGMDKRRNPRLTQSLEMLGPAGGMLASLASMRPGLVEEVIAMPNYFNFIPGINRLDNPRSEQAANSQEHLEMMLRGEMGAPEPENLGENASYNAGVMFGQLPIPGKSAANAVKGGMGMLEKIGKAGVEFFSPVIKPSPANYAAGTAFGTALSQLPEGVSKIQKARELLDPMGLNPVSQMLRILQDEKDVDPPEFASGGFIDVDIPGSSPKTPANQQPTYQGPSADPYQGLLNYGAGPERDFFPGRTFTPMDVDFSDWSVDLPKQPKNNTSQVAGVLGSLPGVWKGLGYADKLLGTGMQEGIKGFGKGMLSKLGIGGGAAGTSALAPLGGVSMGGAPVTTALPASLGGTGAAGSSSALSAAAPYAMLAAPVLAYALSGGFKKKPAAAGGSYDGEGGLSFDLAQRPGIVADKYGITDDQVWERLLPMVEGAYGTDNWNEDYFQNLVAKPEGYKSTFLKGRLPDNLSQDEAMNWVLYGLLSSKNSLWTGKEDIMHAYEDYRNAFEE